MKITKTAKRGKSHQKNIFKKKKNKVFADLIPVVNFTNILGTAFASTLLDQKKVQTLTANTKKKNYMKKLGTKCW
jgi:hypothetical protein